MINSFTSYRRQWFADAASARRDVMAGVVVALALIPEAIGFSIIAGVDPRVGLYASVAIAMVVAFTGGRSAMISAATAAVAVVVDTSRASTWRRISVCGHDPYGHDPDRGWCAAARSHDAVRIALGDHRFRELARDPDIHGPGYHSWSVSGGRPMAMVGGGLAIIYLPSTRHDGSPVAAGRDPRPISDKHWLWLCRCARSETWARCPKVCQASRFPMCR